MARKKKNSKAYVQAVKYYPNIWNREALSNLVTAGKLFDWELKEIAGEDVEEKPSENKK